MDNNSVAMTTAGILSCSAVWFDGLLYELGNSGVTVANICAVSMVMIAFLNYRLNVRKAIKNGEIDRRSKKREYR